MVILDIDMPKNCMECPLFDDRWDYPTCYANQNSSGYTFPITEKRMSFCPIKCDVEDIKQEILGLMSHDDYMVDGFNVLEIIDNQIKGNTNARSSN